MAQLLLVSHDAESRLAIEPALYASGHHVHVADTAGDAIDLLSEVHFDAVLCEADLPDVKARKLMRHIKDVYGIPAIAFGHFFNKHRSWLSLPPKHLNGYDLAKMVERAL
ncbi:hypothetical protein BH10PLA1_BH10PLA1_20490 [soil metagenome]